MDYKIGARGLIHRVIRQKQKGMTKKQIALGMKISRRRVKQIWKSYAEGKREPVLGREHGLSQYAS